MKKSFEKGIESMKKITSFTPINEKSSEVNQGPDKSTSGAILVPRFVNQESGSELATFARVDGPSPSYEGFRRSGSNPAGSGILGSDSQGQFESDEVAMSGRVRQGAHSGDSL